MKDNLLPFNNTELLEAFSEKEGSINKHLLILYSLAIGLFAQRTIELGIGNSTRALRAAIKITGGKLFSCDIDKSRFANWLEKQDEHWSLDLCNSKEFLLSLTPPFDFALHDAAHDYWQVVEDLKNIIPLMKRYGIICLHDTQHSEIGIQMVHAISDAVKGCNVSYVHLPFSYGLTIMRIEESDNPPLVTPWNKGGKAQTNCFSNPLVSADDFSNHNKYYLFDWVKNKIKDFIKF